MRITVIVPVRVSDITHQALPRIADLLRTIPDDRYDVIVVDYGSEADQAVQLQQACGLYDHARVIRVDCEVRPFSAGHARDIGAQHATTDVVMFNDIDCIASADMYRRIADEAEARRIDINAYEFFSLPIAFLTYEGTDEYKRIQETAPGSLSDSRFYEHIISNNRHIVLSMAYTGSTVVVNRLHFLAIGGSNKQFHGHGAEDFEVKHRLAGYNPIATRPIDYYTDYKSNQIHNYVGFRAYFALYGLEALYRGLYLVHLWHPKREISGTPNPYSAPTYTQSKRNFPLLKELMKGFDDSNMQPPAMPDEASAERTLVLVRPNSTALSSMRHALPLMGRFETLDESLVSTPDRLLEILREKGFTRVGFLNPYGNEHRLALYRAVKEAGFPFWVFDRGALPHSWFFDPNGFNWDSGSYHADQWDQPLKSEQRDAVTRYLQGLHASDDTLEANGGRKSLDFWRSKFGVGPRKVLFIPLQRPSDTVTRYFGGAVGPYENFYSWVSSIAAALDPSEWLVLAKKHPNEKETPEIPGVTFVPNDAHVHDMLELADKVLLLNSGTGVLSIAFGKPVICCGNSFYCHSGLAWQANSPDEAVGLVRSELEFNWEKAYRFVYHLIGRVYSFGVTSYTQRTNEDGSIFTAASKIAFSSIRGLTASPVALGVPRNPVPFNSILFSSFGGEEASARAKAWLASRAPKPGPAKPAPAKPAAAKPVTPTSRAVAANENSAIDERVRSTVLYRMFSIAAIPVATAKQRKKLKQKPTQFFLDAKSPISRFVGKRLGLYNRA